MKILIVEDFQPIAKAFSEVLRAQGHQVQCVVGFSDLENLHAVDLDDKPVVLTESFDFAFVDGQLAHYQNPIDGPAVVARLVRSGVKCFGISTVKELNEEMLTNGALHAVNKAAAFVVFANALVSVEDIFAGNTSANQRLQETCASIQQEQYKSMRKAADALIARYL